MPNPVAPNTSSRYATLDNPLNPSPITDGYSKLHDLYPGQPMEASVNIDRRSIPHADPEAAQRAYQQRTSETKQYAVDLQTRAMKAGGGDAAKVTSHAASDPDEMVNDPGMRDATVVQPPAFNDTVPVVEPPPMVGPPPYEMRKASVEKFTGAEGDKKKEEKAGMYIWIILGVMLAVLAIAVYFFFFRAKGDVDF